MLRYVAVLVVEGLTNSHGIRARTLLSDFSISHTVPVCTLGYASFLLSRSTELAGAASSSAGVTAL
jgi:hypothetical protein